MHSDDNDDHDLGLAHDLNRLQQQALQRRVALRWLLGAGGTALGGAGALAALAGCGGGGSAGDTASSGGNGSPSSGGGSSTTSGCSVIPEETAGPYPGDGSNNGASGGIANALALTGIVRPDIRSSIAGATGVATGVPLQVVIELVNTNASCADLAGYAIYVWHCDAQGRYSMYSS
ncbi:intradiol ring-cleavage dioxygenase, partial [Pelomonas sp. HMWF004]